MITPLAEALDTGVFGGKAVQLGAAIRDGLPVPEGYALPPELVEAVTRADSDAIEQVSRVCPQLGLVAVRSSAMDEDSADASFAGTHLSVLAVSGLDAIVDAVVAVHRSGHDLGAQNYRSHLGLELTARMGVIVQKLINAEVAGVLFTRNPVTGADERVIEASWGLGEAVVAGLVTPDSYRVARGGSVLERVLGDKDVAIRPHTRPDGAVGTEEVPVDVDRADVFCLDDGRLAALDDLASRCDQVYGSSDHDIEFAFGGDRLFLLQRRPITRV